jgi:hypothetical protein
MSEHLRPYLAYLLRLWATTHDGQQVWHASLESPHGDEHHQFATLDALCEFLRARTAAHKQEKGGV